MNALYKSIGISKQSFHQQEDKWIKKCSEEQQLLLIIFQLRKDHPTMGARDMYHKIQPEYMGRDAFERFCKLENLTVRRIRNHRITTDSSGVIRFENLIEHLIITRLNQVWQSDITYFEVNGMFYYITFIIDLFSRRIVGYHTSKRLTTEQTTMPGLLMAIKTRKRQAMSMSELILHSDGGGQYYAKEFLKITRQHNILNSMCKHPWENAFAERINGIIKNNYLIHKPINSFEDLVKEVDRSVELYNTDKPHSSLQKKTPIEFEKNYLCDKQKADDEKVSQKIESLSRRTISVLGNRNKKILTQISL